MYAAPGDELLVRHRHTDDGDRQGLIVEVDVSPAP